MWPFGRKKKGPRELTPRFSENLDLTDRSGSPVEPHTEQLEELPSELLWLLDAPLFIDNKQVEAFYDAILRPDYEGASVTLSNSIAKGTKLGAQATVGAALPWFKAEVQGSAEET